MTDEPRLIAAFLESRDEAAFRALYRVVTPAVHGLALRLAGGDAVEAADVVQEAWVRAVDRLDRFRTDAEFTPWLRGIAVHCWRERARRRGRRAEIELDDATVACASPEDPGEALVDAAALRTAVNALPDGYRAVLVLHDVEGYTHDEIAAFLGVTAGTSKSQLARARARLRSRLTDASDPASAQRTTGGRTDARR
jgi:RNA polymerase sigma-70 factor (ECF subfamily)